MKRLAFFLLIVATFATTFYSCKTNTDDLWDSIHQLDGRVTSLEDLCKQMNGNISSLQKLVQALQNNNSITKVTPIKEGEKVTGYTISFLKGEPITIYHGEKGDKGEQGDKGDTGTNGKDGTTPAIGVKQHADGIYYWTLNGDWLRDNSGNMIKAEGKDGANGNDGEDGVTPLLEIRNGHWYLSSDNGQTWTNIGQATGDNFFSDVDTSNPNYVIFKFKDGSSLTLNREEVFDITFDKEEIAAVAGHTYEIKYKINGADKDTQIEVLAQGNFKAKLNINDYTSGTITVITPTANFEENRIIVLASDGKSKTIMRTITFVEGVILITSKSYIVEAEGGEIEVELKTNVNYTVHIPEEAKSWISLLSTTRSISTKTLLFKVSANNGASSRYATIQITDNLNAISDKFLITQNSPVGAVEWKVIEIKLPGDVSSHISEEEKESIVYLKIIGNDLNKDDCDFIKTLPYLQALDLSEANNEKVIPTLPIAGFKNSTIKRVTLPQKLERIPDSLFYESQLMTIEIPEAVNVIGYSAFTLCKKMTGDFVISEKKSFGIRHRAFRNCGLTGLIANANSVSLGDNAFEQCPLRKISFKKEAIIGHGCFRNCDKLQGDLIIPEGDIAEFAFTGCPFDGNLILGENVTFNIYSDTDCYAFYGCLFTGTFILPKTIKKIPNYTFITCQFDELQLHEDLEYIGIYAFRDCTNLEKIYCKSLVPPTLDSCAFPNYHSKGVTLYVHYGTKERYAASAWGGISGCTIEEINFN